MLSEDWQAVVAETLQDRSPLHEQEQEVSGEPQSPPHAFVETAEQAFLGVLQEKRLPYSLVASTLRRAIEILWKATGRNIECSVVELRKAIVKIISKRVFERVA